MSNHELTIKAEELKSLMAMRSELEEQINDLQAELKDYMDHAGTDELRAGNFMIRWKMIESVRFNSRKFRADFPALYADYSEPTQTKRFSLA